MGKLLILVVALSSHPQNGNNNIALRFVWASDKKINALQAFNIVLGHSKCPTKVVSPSPSSPSLAPSLRLAPFVWGWEMVVVL